jgi:hypothetical protein
VKGEETGEEKEKKKGTEKDKKVPEEEKEQNVGITFIISAALSIHAAIDLANSFRHYKYIKLADLKETPFPYIPAYFSPNTCTVDYMLFHAYASIHTFMNLIMRWQLYEGDGVLEGLSNISSGSRIAVANIGFEGGEYITINICR